MLLIDALMIVGPIMAYVPQYNMIKETNKIGSFSMDICAILLISNILRIFFWFAHGYTIVLFLQSILMVAAQLILLNVCVEAKRQQQLESEIGELATIQSSDGFSMFDFWRWSKFSYYVTFLTIMTVCVGVMTWAFSRDHNQFFGQILGFMSMSIEALLGLPQFYKNHQTKSVAGLSFILVFTWFLGDFLKTLYYIIEFQPVQFIMCGTIQLTVDILIILQIIAYRKNTEPIEVKTEERV